jgi:hypothetical protein
MIDTLDQWKFVSEFKKIRPDNFSREALFVLFDFFEEIDPNMEFDPIAISCDFQEFDNFNDFKSDWGSDIETMEELENHTTVIKIPESEKFVIQQF